MIQQAGRPLHGPPPDLDRIVAEASRRAGVQAGRFRLLRHFATAVYLVEDVPVCPVTGISARDGASDLGGPV
jgi:hypothetical protein